MNFVLNILRIFYGIHVLLLVHISWCEECSFSKWRQGTIWTCEAYPPLSLRTVNTEEARGQMTPPFFAVQVFNRIKPGGRLCPTHYHLPPGFLDSHRPCFLSHSQCSVITNTIWLPLNCPTNKPLFYVSVIASADLWDTTFCTRRFWGF